MHLVVTPSPSEHDSSQSPLYNYRAYIQDTTRMVRRSGRTLRAGHSSHIPASSHCFNLGPISGSRVEGGRNGPFSAIPGGVSHPCPCRRLISSETSVRCLGPLLFCLQSSIVSSDTWHAPGVSAFVVRRTAMLIRQAPRSYEDGEKPATRVGFAPTTELRPSLRTSSPSRKATSYNANSLSLTTSTRLGSGHLNSRKDVP